jgi:hypothetical protein
MSGVARHTGCMNRDQYIARVVEAYIPDASNSEKVALSVEFYRLFEALHQSFEASERFDSQGHNMLESESLNQ